MTGFIFFTLGVDRALLTPELMHGGLLSCRNCLPGKSLVRLHPATSTIGVVLVDCFYFLETAVMPCHSFSS